MTINASLDLTVRITLGLLSLTAAMLACLQTYLKFSERAEFHRQAAAKYGSLLKEVDHLIAIPPKDDHILDVRCGALRERWDKLSLEAPTIPEKIWEKHEVQVSEESQTIKASERTRRQPNAIGANQSPVISSDLPIAPKTS